MGSSADPQFDAIVRLGKQLFNTPICQINFVDSAVQWTKASEGFDFSTISREWAFCNYVIADGQTLIVEDVERDIRFRDNPFVVGPPGIRFYAGHPISVDEGLHLGAVCVIDTVPRNFDPDDAESLRALAEIVSNLLRHRRDTADARRLAVAQAELTETVLQQASDLTIQKRIFEQASSLAKFGAWENNLRTGTISWSDGMFDLYEVDRDYVPSLEGIYEFYPPAERLRLSGLVGTSRLTGKGFDFEGRMTTARGREVWVRAKGEVEIQKDGGIRLFGTHQDITEQRELLNRTRYLAEHEPLTGLSNRVVFQDRIEEAVQRLHRQTALLAVMIIDLDHFKDINDSLGHIVGDRCLRKIAQRIRRACSDATIVARVGGDEFAIIFEHLADQDEVAARARAIMAVMRRPVRTAGETFPMSASIGIAIRHATKIVGGPIDIIREADLALYQAKTTGRDAYAFFTADLGLAAEQRLATLRDIRLALQFGELELHYQAKVSLADRKVDGFEALLRWRKRDGQIATAGEFEAAFRDFSLSRRIGLFVVNEALDQAAAWQQQGVPFGHIAINLSASQFRDPAFARRLLSDMDRHQLARNMIQVEITEDVLLSEGSDAVRNALETLAAGGIRIAFDDFGTGFASLTHLREFPVHKIKIDRSFVGGISTSGEDAAIVQAIVALARNLKLKVVAEGIESEAVAELLLDLGCHFGQGYLFSRAIPGGQVPSLLRLGLAGR